MMEEHEIKIKTLTPLWTGDINGECSRVKETGIIGSLRWWYEALVRGLGGYTCDPTEDDSCSLDYEKFKRDKEKTSLQEALDQQICPACQLFGCTGWKKRFRLEIEVLEGDISKGSGPEDGLKSDSDFKLKIIELSKISNYHRWFFKKTLEIVEEYGAIGGRTTWKPGHDWGTSYGIITVDDYHGLIDWDFDLSRESIQEWLKDNQNKLDKENKEQWFNFINFWVIKGQHLDKDNINKIVNRRNDKPEEYKSDADDFDKWLGGRQGISKKIFSFSGDNKIERTFGYVKKLDEIETIEEKIDNRLDSSNLKTGQDIIGDLK